MQQTNFKRSYLEKLLVNDHTSTDGTVRTLKFERYLTSNAKEMQEACPFFNNSKFMVDSNKQFSGEGKNMLPILYTKSYHPAAPLSTLNLTT